MMPDQRNETYRAVAAGNIDPRDCDLNENRHGFVITHSSSNSIIKVGLSDGRYIIETKIENDEVDDLCLISSWAEVPRKIKKWAEAVGRKDDIPDLWSFSRKLKTLARYHYDDIVNKPFSMDEQAKISAELAGMKEYMRKTYSFVTGEQMALIGARFDDAAAATSRMGRKDWVLLFSGTIFTLIVTDLLTPSIAHEIFVVTLRDLGHILFGGGPALLSGLP